MAPRLVRFQILTEAALFAQSPWGWFDHTLGTYVESGTVNFALVRVSLGQSQTDWDYAKVFASWI